MQRLSQAVEWIGAELRGDDVAVSGACIDTRQLQPGQLFVALPGSRVDGHDYVRKAASLGAAAALVARPVECGLPQLIVADVLSALQQIAMHWRRQWAELSQGLLLAVTGSNGKTSVKTLLASILEQSHVSFATPGNLNNHIGVPLCLLNLRPQHQRAVIEMGANHPGEIAQLTALAQPDIGVITNAGDAHLEGFGSRDGVARAKGELFQALGANAQAIINADDAYAPLWRELAAPARILQFGRGAADVRALNENGPAFELHTPQGQSPVRLQLSGAHNVMNALAAAAAAHAAGADLAQIRAGLEAVAPVAGRLQVQERAGVHLINDAYNANPNSMAAAIAVLAARPPRRHLVIGDMAELGAATQVAHTRVGEQAREQGIEMLWACGQHSRQAVQAFGPAARHFDDLATLAAALRKALKPGDTVLIKGSRSAAMERLIALLDGGC